MREPEARRYQFIRLQLGRFEPPPEVSDQYTEYWLANWQKQNQIARANGAASTLQEVESPTPKRKSPCSRPLLRACAARRETDDASGYLLALRLIETLDKMVKQSQDRLPASGQAREQVLPAQSVAGPVSPSGVASTSAK
ncbi:MAG: hypothetical protein R3C44_01280 [Chloroflexota bacterium]